MEMLIDQDDENKYFHDALNLFYETQWLYKFPVTEILIKNCLNQFPDEWTSGLKNLSNEELNELVVNKITKSNWPKSLLLFVGKTRNLDKLSPIEIYHDLEILPKAFIKGLCPKKQHEILQLANLVNSQCTKEGIKTIVDLGSGLGYVCQLLNFLYGYRVLGLESNSKNVDTAKRRQEEFYPSSIDRVTYICSKINLDSVLDIESFLKNSNNSGVEDFCLIGLHACADLGVDACKLFSKISSAKILVILSCCYHKMEITSEKNQGKEEFRNFPVSKTLRKIVENSDRNYGEILKRPFLRLACQEPAIRWTKMSSQSHRQHAFYVLARAVLELFAHQNSITLKKLVHKATRKSQCANFPTYLEDVLLRYEFKSNNGILPETQKLREAILLAWNENYEKLEETEIYTGLQLMLQSPAESLVLRDRRCWLGEMGYETEIVPVTSRNLSPRSHAIVSRKKIK